MLQRLSLSCPVAMGTGYFVVFDRASQLHQPFGSLLDSHCMFWARSANVERPWIPSRRIWSQADASDGSSC